MHEEAHGVPDRTGEDDTIMIIVTITMITMIDDVEDTGNVIARKVRRLFRGQETIF